MKIIGLGHYSRTGKDTLANSLILSAYERQPGVRVAKRPFAWKLKEICHDLYEWAGLREPEYYDTPEGEKFRDVPLPLLNGMTPVQIWVAFGTPAVRENVYDKTWIDYVLNLSELDILIIPDVRFPNEVKAIRDKGGLLVKVVRPGYGPRPTVADRALVGFDGWDYIAGGSGKMEELHQWGSKLAHWALDGPSPIQSAADRRSANSVEVITPYEAPAKKVA